MTLAGWMQILVFCVIIVALAKPLGAYMTRVFDGERTLLSPIFVPIERVFYALAGTLWIVPIGLSLPWMYREPAPKA